jgi:eukaryotic-like serine/threonine-protein kinase
VSRPSPDSDSLAPEAAWRVEQICSRFEAAWKAGHRPLIEDLLGQVGDAERVSLLHELVALEIACRRAAGEQPDQQHYANRFPILDPSWLAAELADQGSATPLSPRPSDEQPATLDERRVPDSETTPAALLADDAAPTLGPLDLASGSHLLSAGSCGPPVQVPGYEIVKELGRGGMGVVYLARQAGLNRLVALKMVLQGEHAGVEQLARFQAEAEAIARLQHPHIVQIYEVGQQRGLPYFSLEYCPSGSLEKKLNGTPLPAREAAQLTERLARAMAAAHSKGVIHRDLKPANVLLTDDGTPKITDFGLAKRVGAEGVTLSGSILGTPSYMAPEQAGGRSKEVSPATDVYALGAILYEMLTGRPPFRASTHVDTLIQVVSEEPVPPSRLQPKLPPDLETICLHCLQKEPARRYPTAAALADDLHCFLDGRPIQARPVGAVERLWRWCRRNPALAGAVGLAAAALLAVALVSSLLAYQQTRASARLKKSQQETSRRLGLSLAERGITFGEEGEPARAVLWLARSLRHIPADDAALQQSVRRNLTAWSRSAHRLAAIFPAAGQADRLATSDPEPLIANGVSWSRDGHKILTSTATRVVVWNGATGEALASLSRRVEIEMAALAPDGISFVTVSKGSASLWNAATGQLFHAGLVDLDRGYSARVGNAAGGGLLWHFPSEPLWDTGDGQPLSQLRPQPALRARADLPGEGPVKALAYSPDGRFLILGGSSGEHVPSGWVQPWDVQRCKALGPFPAAGPVAAIVFSSDGKRFAVANDRYAKKEKQAAPGSSVRVWDLATRRPIGEPLVRDTSGHDLPRVRALAFSPDGSKILMGSDDGTASLCDVATGKPLTARLQHRAPVTAVAFSPDGKTVLTGSDDHRAKLWEANNGQFLHVLDHGDRVVAVAFNPDGKTAATLCQYGSVHVWDVQTGRSVGQPLGPRGGAALAFSPDGKMLLSGDGDGLARLWRLADKQTSVAPLYNQDQVLALTVSKDGSRILTGLGRAGAVAEASEPAGVAEAQPAAEDALPPSSQPPAAAQLWDAATGRLVGSLPREDLDRTRAVAFSPDGGIALIATVPQVPRAAQPAFAIRIWDLGTLKAAGHPVIEQPPSGHPASMLALEPDGKAFAVAFAPDAGTPGWCGLFEFPTGSLLHKLSDEGPIQRLAFSPDGNKLLTVSGDRVRTWDTRSGSEAGPPVQQDGHVITATFSADGLSILTGTRDQTARLWDATSGRRLGGRPLWHPAPVLAVALSPDGTLALTGCADGTARLWSLASSLPLGPALHHDDKVTAVAFRPDGTGVVTGSLDRTLRLWDVPAAMEGSLEKIELRLAVETGMEIEENGAVRFLDYGSWAERR